MYVYVAGGCNGTQKSARLRKGTSKKSGKGWIRIFVLIGILAISFRMGTLLHVNAAEEPATEPYAAPQAALSKFAPQAKTAHSASQTATVFSAFQTDAVPSASQPYVLHTVEPGDTLWDIAGLYLPGGVSRVDFIHEIRRFNGMESSGLTAGQVLRIPVQP